MRNHNIIFSATSILLILFSGISCKTYNSESITNIYKNDFLEAAELISKNYIYLERKTGISRESFLNYCKQYAEDIEWNGGTEQFTDELCSLCSSFPDSHFSWSLGKSMQTGTIGYLGLTFEYSPENGIVVSDISKRLEGQLAEGDKLVSWNGTPALEAASEMAEKYPRSSERASMEIAARNMTIHYPQRPLHENLEPVTAVFENSAGSKNTVQLNWFFPEWTTDWRKRNNNTLFLQKNGYPSAEEIPSDCEYVNQSLIYYFREINDHKFIILHPRDFYYWNLNDLELTFQRFIGKEDSILILDLKDSAGGAFDQVLFLSRMLDIEKPFTYFYDIINSDTGMRTSGIDSFSFIEDEILISEPWKGEVYIRTNELTASGGDFFSRWFQLNRRGLVTGEPTSGGGGGTDDFNLTETGSSVSFPLRERIIACDDKPVEENPVIPEFYSCGTIEELLSAIKEAKSW